MNSIKMSLVGLSLAALTGCISQQSTSSSQMVVVASPESMRIDVGNSDAVELIMPNGDVDIVGADINHVEATIQIRCPDQSSRCRSRANKTRLTARRDDGRVRLGVDHSPGNNASVVMSVKVPRDRPLFVNMKYGELSVSGVEDNMNVVLKAGEISIDVPQAAVRDVHLAARFGDASMSMARGSLEGRRPTLVGARLDWQEGNGPHSVDARVRYGEVSVALTR